MQRLAGCPRTAAEDESRSAEGKLPLGSKIKAHNNGFAQQASVLETTKLEELRLEPATSSKVSLHPSLVDWFKGCPSKGIYIYIYTVVDFGECESIYVVETEFFFRVAELQWSFRVGKFCL